MNAYSQVPGPQKHLGVQHPKMVAVSSQTQDPPVGLQMHVPSTHQPTAGSPMTVKLQLVRSATGIQLPVLHVWQVGHVWHVPPQPSSFSQALPGQSGVQPHVPGVPPPPHVSAGVQLPHEPRHPSAPQVLPVQSGRHVFFL